MLLGGVRPGLPLLLRPQASIRMAAGDAAAAANLFANVRLPASILAGALVPLGFGFALPAEGPALAPGTRRGAALRALAQIHAQRPDESEQACIRRCCRGWQKQEGRQAAKEEEALRMKCV